MDNEIATCPLCRSENVEIFAFGECGHVVCYLCSTKMRILCEQTYCSICRQELPRVYYVSSQTGIRLPVDGSRFKPIDDTGDCGIYYPNGEESIRSQTERLLRNFCPCCNMEFETFEILREHVRQKHRYFYCDLCVEHLNLFPFERKYYTRQDLVQHIRQGDRDDKSFKGHPLCKFCDNHFLDNDHLFKHMRQEHYYCHLCTSDNVYYSNFELLLDHYRKSHYLCEIGQCKNIQFTNVFMTEVEFRAHQAAQHSKSRAEARQLGAISVEFQSATARDRRQPRETTNREANNATDNRTEKENQSSRRDRRDDDERERNNGPIPSIPPVVVPSIDEFPTLGSQASSNQSGSQQRGAWSNDVARGIYSAEDFPALTNPTNNVTRMKGTWKESQQQQTPTQVTSMATTTKTQTTTKKPTTSSQSLTNGIAGMNIQEEFPELKSSYSGRPIQSASMFSAWSNVRKSSKQNSAKLKSYRPQTRMNTSRIMNEEVEDDDQYMRRPMSALQMSTAPIVSSNITIISSPSLDTTQANDKTNKQKNQSLPKPQDFPELPTASTRVAESTPLPAGVWSTGGTKSEKVTKEKTKTKSSKKEVMEEVKKMPQAPTSTLNNTTPALRLSELGRRLFQEENMSVTDNLNPTLTTTISATQNQKEEISGSKKKKNTNSNNNTKKITSSDVKQQKEPADSMASSTVATMQIPPMPSDQQVPPGFVSNTTILPPPGFDTLDTRLLPSEPSYIHDPSYEMRKDEFRSKLYELFDSDMELLVHYDQFCEAFHQRVISTEDFLKFTKELFKDKLEEYLLELIVLTPDIKQQIELFTIWKSEIQTKTRESVKNWTTKNLDEKSVYQCRLCQQIMFDSDSEAHNSHHPQLDAEFPSLPSSAISLGRGKGKSKK